MPNTLLTTRDMTETTTPKRRLRPPDVFDPADYDPIDPDELADLAAPCDKPAHSLPRLKERLGAPMTTKNTSTMKKHTSKNPSTTSMTMTSQQMMTTKKDTSPTTTSETGGADEQGAQDALGETDGDEQDGIQDPMVQIIGVQQHKTKERPHHQRTTYDQGGRHAKTSGTPWTRHTMGNYITPSITPTRSTQQSPQLDLGCQAAPCLQVHPRPPGHNLHPNVRGSGPT